jgi:hypothetical protein
MLKFLASTYIEDIELPLDIPINDSQNVLQLMIISETAMTQCLYEQEHLLPEFFHYVYCGISAFLRSIFEYHVSIETVDKDKVKFYTRLVDLTLQLLPNTYIDEKTLQSMLTCVDSMINVAGFRGSMDPKSLRDLLKEATMTLDRLYVKSHHHEHQSFNVTDEILPIQDSINIDFQLYFSQIQTSMELEHYQKIEFEKLCKFVT